MKTSNKTWVDYRIEEMEQKAGCIQLPEFDMDGSYFDGNGMDDIANQDVMQSISNRVGLIIGIVDPFTNN